MKKKLLTILAIIVISICFTGCSESSKARTYRHWDFTIPNNAQEVYTSFEGGTDTIAYYVYEGVNKDDVVGFMWRVDEAYKQYYMSRFRSLLSTKVPEEMHVNWEHELYGFFETKGQFGKWLFCIYDEDVDLMYVMDIAI